MTVEEFATALENSFDSVEPGTLRPDSQLRDLTGWDSLAVLIVIDLIDENFGKSVSGEEVRACETVADLHALGSREAP